MRRRKAEKQIETDVCDRALKELRVPNVGLKLLLGANTGWPDRQFFVGHDRVLLIEFKDPDGELGPKQVYMIEMLKGLGYDVQVHDNREEAFAAIESAKLETAQISKARRQVSPRTRRRYRAP